MHRVTTRVGAIPKMGEQAAHRALLKLLPPDPAFLYELHVNLLRHGQRVCSWYDPKCGACVLRFRCDAHAQYGDGVPAWKGEAARPGLPCHAGGMWRWLLPC